MDNIPYSELLENWKLQVSPMLASELIIRGYAATRRNQQLAMMHATETLKAFQEYKEKVKKHFEEALDE